jgi:cytochrome c biogenesis protein CcmG/thiol:disulfide interchange protein DsbE
MTAETAPETPQSSKAKASLALPLVLVAVLFVFLYIALKSGDPQRLPSALVGKPVPEFELPGIPQLVAGNAPVPGLSSIALRQGRPTLLNVWASWCAPCQAEHPELVALSQRGIPLYGLNYKDKPDDARRFLTRFGNPFRAIGADTLGSTAIDFGVYGVPETFVIDGRGRVVMRHPGPLTPDIVRSKILPALDQAR